MRAAVIEELSQPLVIREVPDPICPPDGAVLRVAANGICRTDWALWSGSFWTGGPQLTPPFVLGHEFAGTIEEVGPEVRGWKAGDRVTFPMNPGDGTCEQCRAGNQHVCARFDTLVPGVSYWGAGWGARVRRRRRARRDLPRLGTVAAHPRPPPSARAHHPGRAW
jgi:D-arabinose 1-dehydrogenase-like Zn-dependent alcohol dehydrogenase